MRKGMNVTAQVAVLDPAGSRATVFIAGHRAPLYSCRGGEISVVHGEGLALGLEFGAVAVGQFAHVAGKLDDGHLQPQTNTKEWQLVLSRPAHRLNHALDPPLPESAGDEQAVHPTEEFAG